MLDNFRCWLRRMMTFNASDWFGSVYAAILRDVIDVAKLDTAQLGVRRENIFVFWFSPFLCCGMEQNVRTTKHD
jgi:hypothetical protein